MTWLELQMRFIRHVGDAAYAQILISEALATVGLAGDQEPREDRYLVIQIALDMFESGKQIRREAFHQPYGPPVPW